MTDSFSNNGFDGRSSPSLALADLPSHLLLAELRRRAPDATSDHGTTSGSGSSGGGGGGSSSAPTTPACGSGSPKFAYNTPLHVFALGLILFLSTAACAFPIVVKRFPRLPVPHHFLFLSRHFGTGVLIATAFVHLLPTAFVSLTDPCLPPFWNEGYPAMPGFIAMLSVLVVVAIEMFFASRGAGHVHGSEYDTYGSSAATTAGYADDAGEGDGIYRDDEDESRGHEGGGSLKRPTMLGQARRSTTRARFLQSPRFGDAQHERRKGQRPPWIDIDDVDDAETVGLVEGASPGMSSRATTPRGPAPARASSDDDHDDLELDELARKADRHADHDDTTGLLTSRRKDSSGSSPDDGMPTPGTSRHSSTSLPHPSPPTSSSSSAQNQRLLLQCLLLEAGILFHSIFIGIALSVSTGPPFAILLLAISFHQTFEGLALGARISAIAFPARSPRPWLMALAYGATTPLGQAVGLAVHGLYDPEGQTGLLMVGVMNAVSSGLLLFAGLVELLAEDFLSEQSYASLRGRRRLQACAAVVAGAGGMALVGAWA